jgi:hypothetical protein
MLFLNAVAGSYQDHAMPQCWSAPALDVPMLSQTQVHPITISDSL